jgi:hypothetical protein
MSWTSVCLVFTVFISVPFFCWLLREYKETVQTDKHQLVCYSLWWNSVQYRLFCWLYTHCCSSKCPNIVNIRAATYCVVSMLMQSKIRRPSRPSVWLIVCHSLYIIFEVLTLLYGYFLLPSIHIQKLCSPVTGTCLHFSFKAHVITVIAVYLCFIKLNSRVLGFQMYVTMPRWHVGLPMFPYFTILWNNIVATSLTNIFISIYISGRGGR